MYVTVAEIKRKKTMNTLVLAQSVKNDRKDAMNCYMNQTENNDEIRTIK